MSPPDDREPPDLSDERRRWLVLDRYLTGEASTEEIRLAREWIADRSGAEIVETVRRIRETIGRQPPPPRHVDSAWEQLRGSLIPPIPTRVKLSPSRAPESISLLGKPRRSRLWLFPAGVAAMAVIALALTRHVGSDAGHATGLTTDTLRRTSRIFTAARGQRAEVRLTDGSRVTLAADSRLTVPAMFDGTERRVLLDGEAYFEVVHDSTRPFHVTARNADVRDVGTRFEVRAYASDPGVRVVVTNGAVRLGNRAASDTGLLIGAGGMARIAADGSTSLRRRIDTLDYTGWTSGVLLLRGGPLRDVAAELSRWYDVDVRIPDSSLGERRITARVDYEALDRVLDHIALALDLSVERRGREITLTTRVQTPR